MRRRNLTDMITHYARCAPEKLSGLLEDRLATDPGCAVTRYLLGCQGFDRGRSPAAVRHMMIAYRTEPRLQSAALLVFAGLNWVSREGASLLPVLLETWEEFRRPDFDRCRIERRLLDNFAEPDPGLEHVAPLARRLWRLPIRTLRSQIREAILSRDAALYPQLTAPA